MSRPVSNPLPSQLSDSPPRLQFREQVEMLAHFRHGQTTLTVVLKDLTRNGTRIDGIVNLVADEAVDLLLPGMRPKLSFVAWANEHGAGLEFGDPLSAEEFANLVQSFGLRRGYVRPIG